MEPKNILCTGVWDGMHEGHLNLINKAAEFGKLYVGVVSDQAVKKQKGDNRPLFNEKHRLNLVDNLKNVYDCYTVPDFDILYLYNYLKIQRSKKIDMVIKGEDQDHIKGFDELLKMGIPIIILPRTAGVSTTSLLEKMK